MEITQQEFRSLEVRGLKLIALKNSEWNDGISSKILPSFRTEAVEDRDVIFNKMSASHECTDMVFVT